MLMNENEIMDIRMSNVMKLAIHSRPIKNRTPIWKDRMEDGRTDKEKTKRHAMEVGRFFGCAQAKSAEFR